MDKDLIKEVSHSIPLLLQIRSECCDGKTRIDMTTLNNVAMNILKRLDLVICKNLERECEYYVGVTKKGRDVCRLLGCY